MNKYRYRLSPDIAARRLKGTYIPCHLQINVVAGNKVISSVTIPAGSTYEVQLWEWREGEKKHY